MLFDKILYFLVGKIDPNPLVFLSVDKSLGRLIRFFTQDSIRNSFNIRPPPKRA